MIRRGIAFFSAFLVAQLATVPCSQAEGEALRIVASDATQYFYVDPIVVFKGDEETTITLELATTGEEIAEVRLASPEQMRMHDDGTHGDRVAGDNIYTCRGIPHNTQWGSLSYGGTHTVSGRLKVEIERTDKSVDTEWIGIGVVHPDQRHQAVQVGDGLYATRHAFFVVDPGGQLLDTQDWPLGYIHCGQTQFGVFEKLYSVFPDVFDFVIVMPAHPIFDPQRSYGENVPYFVRAKNEIQNIGISLYDNTDNFYSSGRLMGMIYHSWGAGAILDHEIGHAWAADMGQVYDLSHCADCSGSHWNRYSDIAGQMASFIPHPDALYGAGRLFDNGDGTWRIERRDSANCPYSPLELYVMGLIPPSQVPDIHLLIDPDITDAQRVTADVVETYTIEDLMAAEGGGRVPSWRNSKKEFKVAFVAVKNKEFTAAEYAFYSLVSKYFASTEQGEWSLTNFHHATGGRATLDPMLPAPPPRRTGARVQ